MPPFFYFNSRLNFAPLLMLEGPTGPLTQIPSFGLPQKA